MYKSIRNATHCMLCYVEAQENNRYSLWLRKGNSVVNNNERCKYMPFIPLFLYFIIKI